MSPDTIMAWGEQGFRYARRRGWDIADAEDIRQAFIVELLEGPGHLYSVPITYFHVLQRGGPHWWISRRGTMPVSLSWLPPTDAQLDASRYLGMLPKADAALMRAWLEGREPTDIRKQDHAAKRRAWARSRILVALAAVARGEAERVEGSPRLKKKGYIW